ncbi:hypothetical protein D3C81_1649910 [compost metagenome]
MRGINVGGKNKIKMAELKEALEKIGLVKVKTYIQSGNILFESDEAEEILRVKIEQMIQEQFGLSIPTMIRTSEEIQKIVDNCPFSDQQIAEAEASSEVESLYVTMLLDVPDAERVEKLKTFDFKGDQFSVQGRDVYLLFYQSIRNSKLAVQVEKLGVPATTRNWKTMNKLSALFEAL